MPRPMPSYLPTDSWARAQALGLRGKIEDDLFKFTMPHQIESDIASFQTQGRQAIEPELLEMPDPLPIVLPDRPPMAQAAPMPSASAQTGASPSAPITAGPAGSVRPSAASRAPAAPPMPQGGGDTDLESWARQEAVRLGIDPEIAVRVANSEGGFSDPVRQSDVIGPDGTREQSFGPYQLNVNGGLGNEAIRRGIDPRNPAHARAAITFALEQAAQGGWGPFHGAARVGVGPQDGIGARNAGVLAPPAPAPSAAPSAASGAQQTSSTGGAPNASGRPTQFAEGLSWSEAVAACGLAGVAWFTAKTGRTPSTVAEVRDAARVSKAWDENAGMHGIEATAALMRDTYGIAAHVEDGVDWEKVRRDVLAGNPVMFDTNAGSAGHYYTVAGARQRADGQWEYDLDTSATDLRASKGNRWYTPDEIKGLGFGTPYKTIYTDNPQTPAPSPAAGRVSSAQPDNVQADSLMLRQPLGGDIGSENGGDYGPPAPPQYQAPVAPYQDEYQSPITAPNLSPVSPNPRTQGIGANSPYDETPPSAPPAPFIGPEPVPLSQADYEEQAQSASRQAQAADPLAAPPGDPYGAGQAAPMVPQRGRFLRPAPSQDVAEQEARSASEISSLPWTQRVAHMVNEAPGRIAGYAPPAGGADRMGARIMEINQQAARDQGRTDGRAFFTAAEDPAWREQNPGLADEYDQLQAQYGLTVVGQTGDNLSRIARPRPTTPVAADQNAVEPLVQGVVRRGREALATVGGMAEDSRPRPHVYSPTAPEGSVRRYHGTAGAFDAADPGKFDENGLYGPGYYLTSDPRVAGGYAGAGPKDSPELQNAARRMVDAQTRYADAADAGTLTPQLRQDLRIEVAEARRERDALIKARDSVGPNIRPVDLPKDLNMLDADAPLTPETMQRVRAVIDRLAQKSPEVAEEIDDEIRFVAVDLRRRTGDPSRGELTNDELVTALMSGAERAVNRGDGSVGGKGLATEILERAGFDGIAHKGGQRVPMLDDAGKAIEHDVSVVFPGSVNKVRNALSGTEGGGYLPFDPASAAAGAAAGGEVDEDGNPTYDPLRAAGGVLVAGIGGKRVRPVLTHLAPDAARVAREAAAGPRRGAQLAARVPDKPPSMVPPLTQSATALTDSMAGRRWAEDTLQAMLGEGRLAPNAAERSTTQARINAGGIADAQVERRLTPIVQDAADAGLDHELLLNVADSTHLARLEDAYSAAKQRVLDQRAERIAAMQQRGASQNVIDRMQAKAETDAEAAGTRALHREQGVAGTGSYTETRARLEGQQQRLGASGQADQLGELTGRVDALRDETRQRLVASGVIADTPEAFSQWLARNATHQNPIAAVREAVVKGEQQARRNDTTAGFADLYLRATEAQLLESAPGEMVASGGKQGGWSGNVPVTYLQDGKRVTIHVSQPIADGIETASAMGTNRDAVQTGLKSFIRWMSSNLTQARISFLPVNLKRDFEDYALKTAAIEGGPQNLPAVTATWLNQAGKAVADIVASNANARTLAGGVAGGAAGASSGDENTSVGERIARGVAGTLGGALFLGANPVKATGKAAEFVARGGGSDVPRLGGRAGERWYREIVNDGGTPIRSVRDLATHAGDWLHDIVNLQGARGINDRTELISRTAAMTRADTRGEAPIEAVMRGRDATYDPAVAGTLIRAINGYVPFTNATVQTAAQTGRIIKSNPLAFGITAMTTTVPVVLAAEAWNRSDPDRAAAYDDVSQTAKDSGLVVMLPWAGSDARGSRPNYLWLPGGITQPLVVALREAARALPGLEPSAARVGVTSEDGTPQYAASVLSAALSMFSPLKGESPAQILASMTPPPLKQGVELYTNKSLFSGAPIAAGGEDTRSSALARSVAGGVNAVGRAIGNDTLQNVQPGQAQYLINAPAAIGDILTGASEQISPSAQRQSEDRPIQNFPSAGVLPRFIRDQGGANLKRAQDERLPEEVRTVLEEAGLPPSTITVMPASVGGRVLTRDEQLDAQNAFNEALPEELARAQSGPQWGTDPAKAVQAALSRARTRAMKTLPKAS